MVVKTQNLGQKGEEQALAYLLTQGLLLVARNYKSPFGEVDLVMKDKDFLVMIEVRLRSHTYFGGGVASITYAKQQKIVKTTLHYLRVHKKYDKLAVRFDVVSIDGKTQCITWIKSAFDAEY